MSEPRRVAVLLETSLEYGRGLVRGIVRYARLHGPWSLVVPPWTDAGDPPVARSGGADGVIARIRSPRMARTIRRWRRPAVVLEPSFDELDRVHHRLGFSEIRSESAAIGRMAADHLLGLGCRRFAYCGLPGCLWSRARQEAFTDRAGAAGFPCAVYTPPRAAHGLPWEREMSRLAGWLRSLPRPVGLMACNDDRGRQVLQACAAAGLRVPEEVAVVGVDDDALLCELSDPPLSSVALDLEGAGYRAAELLEGLMAGRVRGRRVVTVDPVRVVSRRSSDVLVMDDSVVARALRFIRDHANRPMGIDAVVERAGVSRRTLERRFAAAVGRSLFEEMDARRMDRARRLLMETDLPVTRVAETAGFSRLKPMLRAFRRAEGTTPAGYRQRARRTQGDR